MSKNSCCWKCGQVNPLHKPFEKVCQVCKKPFLAPNSLYKCCSEACKQVNAKQTRVVNRKPLDPVRRRIASDKAAERYRNDPVARARVMAMSKQYRKSPSGRVRNNLRRRIKTLVHKGRATGKNLFSFHHLCGCKVGDLMKHLQSGFDSTMTWENYGSYWHIDHVKPLAAFDLTDLEQRKLACHWSNLQPLEAKANMFKHDKF